MRVVVDTGVFSASLSRRRRVRLEAQVGLMAGHQIFIAAATVSELRYGALVAGWGEARRQRLEASIQATTVVPVSDALLTTIAELRHACRQRGHPLNDRSHASDLWIVGVGPAHRRPAPHRGRHLRERSRPRPSSLSRSQFGRLHQSQPMSRTASAHGKIPRSVASDMPFLGD